MEFISQKLDKLSINEQADLCCGKDTWRTNALPSQGIPSIFMADGPNGLRKQEEHCDHLGANGSIPATCFPTLGALAATWNPSVIYNVGRALGAECRASGVSVLLGPGINIKRGPLGGRNFEYFTEDPYLCGVLASAYVNGVQSTGTGTALKHFAANNQESNRLSVDVQADERTLREIYLAGFEYCIKNAKPWMVMCAYNRLNGTPCAENRWLLTEVLRDEWGFDGAVVSDWGAVNDRADAIAAGLDLEMPGSFGNGQKSIVKAIKDGRLSASDLRISAGRMLSLAGKCAAREPLKETDKKAMYDANHALAQTAAEESIVLLRNRNAVLPLRRGESIAVIGSYAAEPIYQGGGSSRVCPTRADSPVNELRRLAGYETDIVYTEGYALDEYGGSFILNGKSAVSASDTPDAAKIKAAVEAAKRCETALIFAGLPEGYQCESYDRVHMRLPEGQNALIRAVAQANPRTVVILMCGSPVEMPWRLECAGIVYCGLAGQGIGEALAKVLFGIISPSGKLAETFPKKLSDSPCFLDFPGGRDCVVYREGIFSGYRYYDAKHIEPMYPFGYGLSYARFRYSRLEVSTDEPYDDGTFTVSCTVKNLGRIPAKETVQLYIKSENSSVTRPEKELKGFAKVALQAGESTVVSFELDSRAFSYYGTAEHDWVCEPGKYTVCIGASSRDIRLSHVINMKAAHPRKKSYGWNSLICDIRADSKGEAFLSTYMSKPEDKMADFFENSPLKVAVNMGNLLTLEKAEDLLRLLKSEGSR